MKILWSALLHRATIKNHSVIATFISLYTAFKSHHDQSVVLHNSMATLETSVMKSCNDVNLYSFIQQLIVTKDLIKITCLRSVVGHMYASGHLKF